LICKGIFPYVAAAAILVIPLCRLWISFKRSFYIKNNDINDLSGAGIAFAVVKVDRRQSGGISNCQKRAPQVRVNRRTIDSI
jgi:hypothetical protein